MPTVHDRVQAVIDAAEQAAAAIKQDATDEAQRYLAESNRRVDQTSGERAQRISELTDSVIVRATAIRGQYNELLTALAEVTQQLAPSSAQAEWTPPLPAKAVPPGAQPPQLQQAASPTPRPTAPVLSETKPSTETESAAASGPSEAGAGSGPEASDRTLSAHGAPRFQPSPRALARRRQNAAERRPREASDSGESQELRDTPDLSGSRRGSEAQPEARLLATQMAVAGSTRVEIERRLREDFGIEDPSAIVEGIADLDA